MIDDKMAKMAVNTLIAYCDGKKCADCAVSRTCDLSNGKPRYFASYPLVGLFGNLHKPPKKTPKFDGSLQLSPEFKAYLTNVLNRALADEGIDSQDLVKHGELAVKIEANGLVKVGARRDGRVKILGKAKCHPDDAFNQEIGIKLAIERAAQNMRKPFTPRAGQAYYYVDTDGSVYRTCFFGSFGTIESQLKVAMGNCFKTRGQAVANADIILKRLKKATELLKTLRDEGEK